MWSYESHLKRILDSRAKQIRAKDEEIQAKDEEIQELMHLLKEAEGKSSTSAKCAGASMRDKNKFTVEGDTNNKKRKLCQLPQRKFPVWQAARKSAESDPDVVILDDTPIQVARKARTTSKDSEVVEITDSEDDGPSVLPPMLDSEKLSRPGLIDAFRRAMQVHFVGPRSVAIQRSERALSAFKLDRAQGIPISSEALKNLLGPALFWRCHAHLGTKQPFRVRISTNPCAPLQPGTPGLCFEFCQKNEAWPKSLSLFVTGRPAKSCVYMGEYELVAVNPPFLPAEQWNTLSSVTKSQWERKIEESQAEHCIEINARIVFRSFNNGREPTTDDVKALIQRRTRASKQEIWAALNRGEERLKVWGLRCVGWDEDLAKRMLDCEGRSNLRKRPRA